METIPHLMTAAEEAVSKSLAFVGSSGTVEARSHDDGERYHEDESELIDIEVGGEPVLHSFHPLSLDILPRRTQLLGIQYGRGAHRGCEGRRPSCR